jgi:hypothetical protein
MCDFLGKEVGGYCLVLRVATTLILVIIDFILYPAFVVTLSLLVISRSIVDFHTHEFYSNSLLFWRILINE